MLVVFVVILLSASQVATNSCSTEHNGAVCTTTCFVSETTNEPTKLDPTPPCQEPDYADYLFNFFTKKLNIHFSNSKYEKFTLQTIITPDLACDYEEISITIENSTIDFIPADAFPQSLIGDDKTCSVKYASIDFNDNHLQKVYLNSTRMPVTFNRNKWEILGYMVNYDTVDCSIDLSNKNITQVNQVFGNLPNLRSLSLANNHIQRINRAFVQNPFLRYLSLSNNCMKVIDVHTLAGLSDLEDLTLAGNQIYVVNKAFNETKRLRILDLQDNNLTTIDFNTFIGLDDLNSLYLSNNQINSINSTFNNTKNLQVLSLSRNNVTEINVNTFIGLSNLFNLDLSHNQIIHINHAFFDLQKLRMLNLSHNQIEVCDVSTFTGLLHLMKLDLSYNKITVLDENFPINIPRLTHLDIRYNLLENLNTTIFQDLTRMQEIDIAHNKLNCHQLIAYSRFFQRRGIELVMGSERNGMHFQGILCDNETIIVQDDGGINQTNQIVDVIKPGNNLEKNATLALLKDMVDKIENLKTNTYQDNETILLQNIIKEQQTMNYLIVIIFIIMLCLFVSTVFCYNWHKISNVYPCKQQCNPVNCEVEMNTHLL